MTTEAVLWPTPGSFSRCSKLSGTAPSNSSTNILESFLIASDFFGAKPHDLMKFKISLVDRFAISLEFLALENRAGVTLLTL